MSSAPTRAGPDLRGDRQVPASAVVAKWENALGAEEADAELPVTAVAE